MSFLQVADIPKRSVEKLYFMVRRLDVFHGEEKSAWPYLESKPGYAP